MWFDKLTTNEINYLPFVLSLSKDLFSVSLGLFNLTCLVLARRFLAGFKLAKRFLLCLLLDHFTRLAAGT